MDIENSMEILVDYNDDVQNQSEEPIIAQNPDEPFPFSQRDTENARRKSRASREVRNVTPMEQLRTSNEIGEHQYQFFNQKKREKRKIKISNDIIDEDTTSSVHNARQRDRWEVTGQKLHVKTTAHKIFERYRAPSISNG